MFESLDVAAYIAQECTQHGFRYNNTKIQKLLYSAYGIMLAWKDGERLCDEHPRLWPYGPVFPKVFKYINKGGNIATYSYNFKENASEDEKTVIETALNKYGRFTAKALSQWSHNPLSAWSRVKEEGAGWNSFIPDDYIEKYFKEYVVA